MRHLSSLCLILVALPIVAQPPARPRILPSGIRNAAGGPGVSPGSLVSIFGTDLAPTTIVPQPGSNGSYPNSVSDVEVRIGVRSLPLLFVSPTQINAQLPYDLPSGALALMVSTPGGVSDPATVIVVPVSPAIFPGGVVRSETFATPSPADPARTGDILIIFCIGLGSVSPDAPAGRIAPAEPLSHTTLQPIVTIGGRQAEVLYSVLAPSLAGVYQVAIRVPGGLASGSTPLVIIAGGQLSPPSPVFTAGTGTNLPPRISSVRSSVFSRGGDRYPAGSFVRFDVVVEGTGESDIATATIRITSASQRYDSGTRAMNAKALLHHWDTTGLKAAADYRISVTLTDSAGQTTTADALQIALTPNLPSLRQLVNQVDLSVEAQGMPLVVTRTYNLDSGYDGPMGSGWSLNYFMNLFETPDGVVKAFNSDGSGSFFKPKAGGGYSSPINDQRTLVKDATGYQLRTRFDRTFHFDLAGRLMQIVDRNRNSVQFAYDSAGRLQLMSSPSGQRIAFTYAGSGKLTSIADPVGRRVAYAYDGAGNLTSVTDASGVVTKYTYDARRALTGIQDTTGGRVLFAADSERRLTEISGDGGVGKVTYRYDSVLPEVEVTDALGNRTTTIYDALNRAVSVRDPAGKITRMEYGNEGQRPTAVIDPNGNRTEWTYDALDNLLTSTTAAGQRRVFTYHPTLQLLQSVTDSQGRVTTYEYDAYGNRTAIINPDKSVERFTYDGSGQLLSKTDRMGQTIRYTYDSQGRLRSKTYPDNSQHVLSYDTKGNLISTAGPNGNFQFTYDSADRLARVVDPNNQVITYGYDAAGKRTDMTYPDGTTIEYTYDPLSRLASIRRSGRTLATYSYDLIGRPIRRTLENGTVTTLEFDQASRLTSIFHANGSGQIFSRFAYTYDPAGNKLTQTDAEGKTEYSYDPLNRLTRVVYPGERSVSYSMDSEGNRTALADTAGTARYTTNQLNQYTQVGDAAYTYDLNGNTISKRTPTGTTTYAYDFDNQLIRVASPAGTVVYSYDSFGRRASKTTSRGTVRYVHDGPHVIAELTDGPRLSATFIYGRNLDELLIMRRENADSFYHQDSLGSTVSITDANGRVAESYTYDAYGTPNRTSAVGNVVFFAGREFDQEVGLYYNRARYYDPALGRFLVPDPIGMRGGINQYNYVAANPVNFVDPLGLLAVRILPNRPWWCESSRVGCTLTLWPFPVEMYVDREAGQLERGGELTVWTHEYIHARLWLESRWSDTEAQALAWESNPWWRNQTRQFLAQNGIYISGDPTFVFPSRRTRPAPPKSSAIAGEQLIARIHVPYADSLVRANVPIFGVAAGTKFKQYKLEYGRGRTPDSWSLIHSSTSAQTNTQAPSADTLGDATIHGNLGTWDTGLKSYVYLPSHPPDHPINLQGSYTVRLTVTGTDGNTIEDRVTVEVGEAIANAWGGTLRSPDTKVALSIPEQAMTDSFRVISIQAVEQSSAALTGSAAPLLSPIYEIREAGERFAKPAVLEMRHEVIASNRGPISIASWEPKESKWQALPTQRDPNSASVSTDITMVGRYYALMPGGDPASRGAPEKIALPIPPRSNVLVLDTFEHSTGQWSNRDGDFGADVAIDRIATLDGTGCLKVTDTRGGGNFAVNVVRGSFDVRDYPIVQLDYKIAAGVKSNFLVRVAGRWYEVRFTDDEKALAYKRVNIAPIGVIAGVVADDQWHTTRFNLHDMLRTKTGNFVVEEMIMADWNVPGFMKLEHGNNQKGATYYVDNFSISRDDSVAVRPEGDVVLVDNFNKKKDTNALGGAVGVFTDAEKGAMKAVFVAEERTTPGHSLSLAANFDKSGTYGGYFTSLRNLDLRQHRVLAFRMKDLPEKQDLLVGLKDREGNETKVWAVRFARTIDSGGWREVRIPLVAFTGIKDWARMDNLSLSYVKDAQPATVLVDDIVFHGPMEFFAVDDFDGIEGLNLAGREHRTFSDGPAAVSGRYSGTAQNRYYQISYGGSIGEAKDDSPGLGYAGWSTDLGGIDCSRCGTLSFLIRGAQGGEKPNIYLDDGNHRWGVDIEKYSAVTTSWQRVTIPLADLAAYGVDLTHLHQLQFAFEWEKMSGTICLDNVQFGKAGAPIEVSKRRQTDDLAAGK